MQVIDPGHTYLLQALDGDAEVKLTFVKREGKGYPGNTSHYPGTTCQEVFRALIDRLNYLNQQIPCVENKVAIFCLLTALWMFELRHSRRKTNRIVMPWDLGRKINPIDGHITFH